MTASERHLLIELVRCVEVVAQHVRESRFPNYNANVELCVIIDNLNLIMCGLAEAPPPSPAVAGDPPTASRD